MIYEYRCKWGCGIREVIKTAWRYSFEEACPKCHAFMEKIIPVPNISTGTFKPDYYHAFGKAFTTERQLKEEIRKHEGETGRQVIEVGNELGALKRLTPVKKKPDINGAMREMKKHG